MHVTVDGPCRSERLSLLFILLDFFVFIIVRPICVVLSCWSWKLFFLITGVMALWYSPVWDPGASKRVLSSNPLVCRWKPYWPFATELGLGCQQLASCIVCHCVSKKQEKKRSPLTWKSFFDCKKKLLACSGFLNQKYEDFSILMRVIISGKDVFC
jgi:hypothetical protein